MSHFYGILKGSRGEATRCATKKSGLVITAASWDGAITVSLWHNEKTGKNLYQVRQQPWEGNGIHKILADGTIGENPIATDLTAAGPDLLASLIECVDLLDAYSHGDHTGRSWLYRAHAAIAKAKGAL